MITRSSCLLLLVAYAVPCDAAIVFSDNFNGENGGAAALNFNSFSKWTVTDGTVDLIGNGSFDLLPGNGLYVDLDGSTGDIGVMTLTTPIALASGNYVLSFDLAGNQRNFNQDNLIVRLLGISAPFSQVVSRAYNNPFITVSIPFTTAAANLTLQFEGFFGGDNEGALLDDIVVETVGDVAAVPEPTSLSLWGLGALGCAIGAYRRRTAA